MFQARPRRYRASAAYLSVEAVEKPGKFQKTSGKKKDWGIK
jgi:hypothetical protein